MSDAKHEIKLIIIQNPGVTPSQISMARGCGLSIIYECFNELNIPRSRAPKKSASKKAQIIDLYTSGKSLSHKQIADMVGASYRHTNATLKALGDDTKKRSINKWLDELGPSKVKEIVEEIEEAMIFNEPLKGIRSEVMGRYKISYRAFDHIARSMTNKRVLKNWRSTRKQYKLKEVDLSSL
jgi:hypothetical protein